MKVQPCGRGIKPTRDASLHLQKLSVLPPYPSLCLCQRAGCCCCCRVQRNKSKVAVVVVVGGFVLSYLLFTPGVNLNNVRSPPRPDLRGRERVERQLRMISLTCYHLTGLVGSAHTSLKSLGLPDAVAFCSALSLDFRGDRGESSLVMVALFCTLFCLGSLRVTAGSATAPPPERHGASSCSYFSSFRRFVVIRIYITFVAVKVLKAVCTSHSLFL